MTDVDLATRANPDTQAQADYAPPGKDEAALTRHHLMIGGTGRAGTSFLVQYLHLCGLDTMMGREGMASWDEHANAGLETFVADALDLPYVIKSAWFQEFVETLPRQSGNLELDAVLIPMRDLVEAASSRVINEYAARYADTSIPTECTRWERWGATPGGVVYSLNPMDQARLLALGFHAALFASGQACMYRWCFSIFHASSKIQTTCTRNSSLIFQPTCSSEQGSSCPSAQLADSNESKNRA